MYRRVRYKVTMSANPADLSGRPLMTRRMLSTEQGAATSLYCATVPERDGMTGRFYDNCHEREPSAGATTELAGELWRRSEAWTTS